MSVSESRADVQRRGARALSRACALLEVVYGPQVVHDLLVNLAEAYEIILSAEPVDGGQE